MGIKSLIIHIQFQIFPQQCILGPTIFCPVRKASIEIIKPGLLPIYYGDNIAKEYTQEWNKDSWRVRLKMARLWAEAVNRHGGDVTVVHLPEIGIKGNTHFPMSDLNNEEIANIMEKWMKEKGLVQ